MVVTAEKIIKAQRLCVADVPGTRECKKCYLYSQRNQDGVLADGQACYRRLAGDTIALIKKLNDFENSQSKLLLMDSECLKEKIYALERQNAALRSPDNVIHCADCEYMHLNKDNGVMWCRLSQGLDCDLKKTDFCSRAKLKQTTNN